MSVMITADVIAYRQGHLSVSKVHDGCINLEAWMINPSSELRETGRWGHLDYEDGDVIANVELELSISAATQLVAALEESIRRAGLEERQMIGDSTDGDL